MTREFDLLVDVPAFPRLCLPPDAFPRLLGRQLRRGSPFRAKGVGHVEYLYRPDCDVQWRMLGVSNTRPGAAERLLDRRIRGGRERPAIPAAGPYNLEDAIRRAD